MSSHPLLNCVDLAHSLLDCFSLFSAAIDQHKQYRHSTPPISYRGSTRGGRGRGSHRNATWVAPHLPQPSTSTSTLPTSTRSTPNHSRSTTPALIDPPPAGGYKNQVLVLNNGGSKTNETTTTSSSREPSKPVSIVPEKPKVVEREVIIGGVVFIGDSRGNKLVRKSTSSTTTGTFFSIPLPL